MKILMISMFSNHFFNWTEQLKDSGHEIYWLDVFDSNTKVEKIDFVHHIIGWRYKWDYPGRYFVKNNASKLTYLVNLINERKIEQIFKSKIKEIQPDVVHSFVMFTSCYPLLKIIKTFPNIKWIYSSWGSDIYLLSKSKKDLKRANSVLSEIDFIFTDCERDYELALRYGFKGCLLGIFPGGGGYNFNVNYEYLKPLKERNLILIKGYEGELGRCMKVLEAIAGLKEILKNYNITIFGASLEVQNYVDNNALKNWENLKVKKKISHSSVMELMGKAIIYIGNSISDGMPNTLLEALVMGVFPIQSNPGGATAEIIVHGKNGYLIEDPEDSRDIQGLIQCAISDTELLQRAIKYNDEYIRPKLEREYIKNQVLERYALVESKLKN